MQGIGWKWQSIDGAMGKAYERRSKNRPQNAARAVFCGGVKVGQWANRRNLVP
jgi:hypothetical protein